MKLRNKKTGDIVEVLTDSIAVDVLKDREKIIGYYTSLAKLNEEWEDYEENGYWAIGGDYTILKMDENKYTEKDKEFGNYFETKEDAEKAVEKLKAWKRLRDSGFRFIGKTREYNQDKHFGSVFFEISGDIIDTYGDVIYFNDDFDLLFGGEE